MGAENQGTGGLPASDAADLDPQDAGTGMEDGGDDWDVSDEDILGALGQSPAGDDDDGEDSDAEDLDDESDDPEEGEEDDAEDDDADDAEAEDAEAEAEPEDKGPQARIDELTRTVAEREERLAARERDLADAQQAVALLQKQVAVGWQPTNAFAELHNPADLDAKAKELKGLREHFRKHLATGLTVKSGDGEIEYSPEQVAEALSKVEAKLEQDLPQRQAFLAERSQYNRTANELWPDLFKPDTQLYRFAEAAWGTYPFLKDLPHAHVFLGTYYEGLKVLEARRKPAAGEKPKPALPKPKLPAPKGKAPSRKAKPYAGAAAAARPRKGSELESYLVEAGVEDMFGAD